MEEDGRSEFKVKIQFDMTGKTPAKPDFALLRAGIAAVQAATPTAAANGKARSQLNLTEALIRLFGDRTADTAGAGALHGRFNPVSVRDDTESEPER